MNNNGALLAPAVRIREFPEENPRGPIDYSKAGWIRAVAVHCGSRPGNRSVFMQNAYDTGYYLALEGFKVVYGGGGAGCMGAVREGAKAGALERHKLPRIDGLTLDFFLATQGACPYTRTVKTIRERMEKMRERSQASIVLPGSVGTFQEKGEWLDSLNGIIKPQISVNVASYFEGWHEYLKRHGGDLKERFYVAADAEKAVRKLVELNRKPAIPETARKRPAIPMNDYVERHGHAFVVRKGDLPVMVDIMSLLCAYDISNVKNQNLFPHGEYGSDICPVVFDDEQAPGLSHQFSEVFNNGFANEDRRQLVHFGKGRAGALEVAQEITRRIQTEGPVYLASKQGEAAAAGLPANDI